MGEPCVLRVWVLWYSEIEGRFRELGLGGWATEAGPRRLGHSHGLSGKNSLRTDEARSFEVVRRMISYGALVWALNFSESNRSMGPVFSVHKGGMGMLGFQN